jgi:hypothetical protein
MMIFNYHDDRTNIPIRFVLLLFVREPRGEREELTPAQIRLERNPVERGPDRVRVVLRAKEKQHSCAHR